MGQSPGSSGAVAECQHRHRRSKAGRHHEVEEDGGDLVACTGKSCKSCAAWAIADCVALCCCPCAVVNLLALAFFKLPCAVARKCLSRRKSKRKKRREALEFGVEDVQGISVKERVSGCTWKLDGEEVEIRNNFRAEELWLELYEVRHLGFGRVSFTGP